MIKIDKKSLTFVRNLSRLVEIHLFVENILYSVLETQLTEKL